MEQNKCRAARNSRSSNRILQHFGGMTEDKHTQQTGGTEIGHHQTEQMMTTQQARITPQQQEFSNLYSKDKRCQDYLSQ